MFPPGFEGFEIFSTVFLGLCLGSFATALSYRMPRDISMVSKTRSSCPVCGHDLGFRDLVPVFSWLFQRGKCRYCGDRIGWRYPLIELATLGLCAGLYHVYGFTPQGLAAFLVAPVLVAIIDIDLHYKIIPDQLNLWVAALGFIQVAVWEEARMVPLAFGGALLYGGFSWLLREAVARAMNREALGLGDVKFFAAAGLWLGPDPFVLSVFMMISGVSGVALALVWKKLSGEEAFPFGPALVVAFAACLLWLRLSGG